MTVSLSKSVEEMSSSSESKVKRYEKSIIKMMRMVSKSEAAYHRFAVKRYPTDKKRSAKGFLCPFQQNPPW